MMNCGYLSFDVDDEYEKFLIRMNPPRVAVDNTTSSHSTLVEVDSANKQGSLLEVVQVLIDLNLTIKRAYISSDNSWFMDVFHVVDQNGNKIYDEGIAERIQQSLLLKMCSSTRSYNRSREVEPTKEHTTIELIGHDRPGLLSEIFAVLTDLNCNIVASEVWTHNSRMACVVRITDKDTLASIEEPDRLSKIRRLLRYVIRGNKEWRGKTSISKCGTRTERRLHQMMFEDRMDGDDCVDGLGEDDDDGKKNKKRCVTVERCFERDYTVVYVKCKDRPKLLFDTVCTLTDMGFIVFHGTVICEGDEAYEEYYIRNTYGEPVYCDKEMQKLADSLEAAIQRRTEKGLRLELCMEDRVGLLSDVTRILRENGLNVTQAEVATRGNQAVDVFYVVDASSSNPVQMQTIEDVKKEIGEAALHVTGDFGSESPGSAGGRFSLGNLLRSRSGKLLSSFRFDKVLFLKCD